MKLLIAFTLLFSALGAIVSWHRGWMALSWVLIIVFVIAVLKGVSS